MCENCEVSSFIQITTMQAEVQTKRPRVHQAKYPYLLTDRKKTFQVCSVCMESSNYELSEKSLQ